MRRRIAIGLYVLMTVACFLTIAPSRLREHTPYNHFALLADGWLHGRLDLGGPPPEYAGGNDFAFHNGKHYVSFPPFPAVILLPFVKIAGSAERLKDGQVFVWLAGIAPAFLFLALERLRDAGRSARRPFENAALAALFGLGTVYWFSAIQGTVWFAAHVVGAGLACIHLWSAVGADRPFLAGLTLGLAMATRTPLAFMVPFVVAEAWRASRAEEAPIAAWLMRLAKVAAPAAIVLFLLCAHNHARFGRWLDFGHEHLAIAWRGRIDKWGLFSFHYLGRNLSIVLAGLPFVGSAAAPFQVNAHGLALWITTPIYAWALWPRRTSPTFWALAVTAIAVAAPSLLYQNSGWVQFGYRFSNDFAPFLFAMIALGGRSLRAPFWLLSAWSIAVNAFGAATFDRAEAARFYFFDRTQKILVEPD